MLDHCSTGRRGREGGISEDLVGNGFRHVRLHLAQFGVSFMLGLELLTAQLQSDILDLGVGISLRLDCRFLCRKCGDGPAPANAWQADRQHIFVVLAPDTSGEVLVLLLRFRRCFDVGGLLLARRQELLGGILLHVRHDED